MTAPPPLIDAAAVASQLNMDPTDGDVLERLEPTVAAVLELVERQATTGEAARRMGALMLAARLYRRRNSPEGVATFTADAAVYVQRNDPDIAMLLGIGVYAPPVVG